MLTRLLVSRLVNIAYIKIWVHLTFVLVHLRKKVHPVQKVSLEPCQPSLDQTQCLKSIHYGQDGENLGNQLFQIVGYLSYKLRLNLSDID